MQKVTHLIPYDAIGGVEVAARSMRGITHSNIEFQVDYVYTGISSYAERGKAFSVLPLMKAARRICLQKPDILVVSLWRACIVGIVVKLARPRQRLVVMLHNVSDVHFLDRFFTSLAARCSCQIWGDSQETVIQRLPGVGPKDRRVISFVTRRLEALPAKTVCPTFIFWGRIKFQKGLDRAIELFSEIRAAFPRARFLIIGPDGGELEAVRSQVQSADLADAVTFLGGLDMEEILPLAQDACFYLQTSRWEGMGMSVVEAMQLGLVPIVTPVGEIARYCHAGDNAILIQSATQTLSDVSALLQDNSRYQEIRGRAIATWAGRPLYVESMLQACSDLLGKQVGDA